MFKDVEVEEGVGRGRELDVSAAKVFVLSLELADKEVPYDLEVVVDAIGLAQLWSFGKRCCGQYCFLQAYSPS